MVGVVTENKNTDEYDPINLPVKYNPIEY